MSETRILDQSPPGADVETSSEVPAVLCQGLRHRFGDHVAVDGIDLVVRPAEVFGLLGPNGAGKTTTLRILNTLLPLQEGTAEVFGFLFPFFFPRSPSRGQTTTLRILNTLLPLQEGTAEVFGFPVQRSPMTVRRLLGYVPQQLSIEAALTGRENVAWFARLFGVPRRERKERVAEALETMGLADAADRLAGTYSGGMVREHAPPDKAG